MLRGFACFRYLTRTQIEAKCLRMFGHYSAPLIIANKSALFTLLLDREGAIRLIRPSLDMFPTCSLKKAIIKQKGQSYYSGGSHPCILGIDEIKNEAKVSYPMAFFGNKFDLNIDGSEYAMNAIDIEIDDYEKELKSNKKKMEEEDTKIRDTFVQIERGWPHPLHCPNYQGAGH